MRRADRLRKNLEGQKDLRQVHKLSGDEKTTEEQLNNATSPHSSVPYRPFCFLPGVTNKLIAASLRMFINNEIMQNKVSLEILPLNPFNMKNISPCVNLNNCHCVGRIFCVEFIFDTLKS